MHAPAPPTTTQHPPTIRHHPPHTRQAFNSRHPKHQIHDRLTLPGDSELADHPPPPTNHHPAPPSTTQHHPPPTHHHPPSIQKQASKHQIHYRLVLPSDSELADHPPPPTISHQPPPSTTQHHPPRTPKNNVSIAFSIHRQRVPCYSRGRA